MGAERPPPSSTTAVEAHRQPRGIELAHPPGVHLPACDSESSRCGQQSWGRTCLPPGAQARADWGWSLEHNQEWVPSGSAGLGPGLSTRPKLLCPHRHRLQDHDHPAGRTAGKAGAVVSGLLYHRVGVGVTGTHGDPPLSPCPPYLSLWTPFLSSQVPPS